MALYAEGQTVRNRFTGRIGTVAGDVRYPQIVCSDNCCSYDDHTAPIYEVDYGDEIPDAEYEEDLEPA